VGSRKRLVFISYETSDGLQYADEAKAIFEATGYETWVWHHDRKSGAYTVEEIECNIRRCYRFLYICTKGSDDSYGQRYERCMAWTYAKPFDILAFDRAFVSPVLAAYNQIEVSPADFGVECRRLAGEWRSQQHEQVDKPVAEDLKENEPLEPA
jgi:hypothetical protein